MNSVEFLTANEFNKLKSNLELTEQERFILEHMKTKRPHKRGNGA